MENRDGLSVTRISNRPLVVREHESSATNVKRPSRDCLTQWYVRFQEIGQLYELYVSAHPRPKWAVGSERVVVNKLYGGVEDCLELGRIYDAKGQDFFRRVACDVFVMYVRGVMHN